VIAVALEEQLGLVQLALVRAILEVQMDGTGPLEHSAGKGRLAALAWAEDGDRGRAREGLSDMVLRESRNITMQFTNLIWHITWLSRIAPMVNQGVDAAVGRGGGHCYT
jgi:hypothetical protein